MVFVKSENQSRTKHAALTLASEEHGSAARPSPDGRGEEEGCRRPKTQEPIGDLACKERRTGGQVLGAGQETLRQQRFYPIYMKR